jgi:REP element-mobilizing transposase RayT
MARRARVFVEGLSYHVYNRVGRGEAPFKLEGEAERFCSLLHEVKKRDGLSVLAWCIMPNHYHLLLGTECVPLWRSIRSLQHAYSRGFNRRCKVLGPLWQARYKARPVQETDALLRVLAYVHLNPVTAGMASDPGRYRWSGHRELLRRTSRPLVDADKVYSLFGGTRRQALRSYVSLLRRERKEPWIGAALESLPWWKGEPLGEDAGHGLDALGRSAGPLRRRLSAAEFLGRVEPLLGVEIRELAGAPRGSAVLVARELVAALAVERWGVGVKALADALGKSRDGVSHWVRRAAHRRAEEPTFARRLDQLDRRLAKALEL